MWLMICNTTDGPNQSFTDQTDGPWDLRGKRVRTSVKRACAGKPGGTDIRFPSILTRASRFSCIDNLLPVPPTLGSIRERA